MTFTVADQPRMINGMEHNVTTVNGLDRVEINNKLHTIGDLILRLRMKQDELVKMRDAIDRKHEMLEMGDLYDEMFGG
jgi:hypothetical protein